MKKTLFLSAATFILAAAVNAQNNEAVVKNEIKSEKKQESVIKKEKKEERKELRKLEGKEVSYRTKQAFYGDFGNIPVSKWERSVNFDKATFIKNGKVMMAYYDADADLVGTTSAKSFKDLPVISQKYISQHYQGYSTVAVTLFDDNELNETDMVMYGRQFDDADNYFVELKNGDKKIALQVEMNGNVLFFMKLK